MTDQATATSEGRQPNPIDLHVGARIRTRRKIMGISQEQLADALGLTFQQVQKYERGANRISASKMYESARALSVPVSYFFEGLASTEGAPEADPQTVFFAEQGALDVANAFLKLPLEKRSGFVTMMRAYSDSHEVAA